MKDFGEWMGAQAPLTFNDPGEYVAPKKAKKVPVPADAHLYEGMVGGPLPRYKDVPKRPGVRDALDELLRLGFRVDPVADVLYSACARCMQKITIPAIHALESVQDHYLRGRDVCLCKQCQHRSYSYRRYP